MRADVWGAGRVGWGSQGEPMTKTGVTIRQQSDSPCEVALGAHKNTRYSAKTREIKDLLKENLGNIIGLPRCDRVHEGVAMRAND